MADLRYVMIMAMTAGSCLDVFVSVLYAMPILFISHFRNQINMFILNICLSISMTNLYFAIRFLVGQFDGARLLVPESCAMMSYAYGVSAIGIPFSFLTFTVHRYCLVVHHTKPLFKTNGWIGICIASQWIMVLIISIPYAFIQGAFCSTAPSMAIYTFIMAIIIPALNITIFNVLIFSFVRSSGRRVRPQALSTTSHTNDVNEQPVISRREISLLRQMIFTFLIFLLGWSPAYLTALIRNFISAPSLAGYITSINSQLCTVLTIVNLFLHNHELKQYLKNIIRT